MTISRVSNLSKTVLVIAGSDPSGGAGIQADLKTLTSLGVYGMTAITALTEQNTRGVSGIFEIPLDFVIKQINCCLSDIGANAIKIGMMHNAGLINGVYKALKQNEIIGRMQTKLSSFLSYELNIASEAVLDGEEGAKMASKMIEELIIKIKEEKAWLSASD